MRQTSLPGLGRSPRGGKWLLTPVFLPREYWTESHGQRSLVGYTVHRVAKTRSQLSDRAHTSMHKTLNGSPLSTGPSLAQPWSLAQPITSQPPQPPLTPLLLTPGRHSPALYMAVFQHDAHISSQEAFPGCCGPQQLPYSNSIPAMTRPSPIQWSPTFLVPGTGFMEDSFSTDQDGDREWFWDDSSILHLLCTLTGGTIPWPRSWGPRDPYYKILLLSTSE